MKHAALFKLSDLVPLPDTGLGGTQVIICNATLVINLWLPFLSFTT